MRQSHTTYGADDGVEILAEELRDVSEHLVQYNKQTQQH